MSCAFPNEMAIERMALGMIARTLPREAWTHEAHFALALWLLRHRPEQTGGEAMRALISGYNESLGGVNSDTAGYHHTITLASMRAAAWHLELALEGAPLQAVLAHLMASRQGDKNWLLDHWSRDILYSVAARRGWVEPDTCELPF